MINQSSMVVLFPSQDSPDTRCPICDVVWKFGGTKPRGEIEEKCPSCLKKEGIRDNYLPPPSTKNN